MFSELCVKSMNGLATSGLITMDEASCIESTEAGRLMSIYYLDLETMRHIMKIEGTETLECLLLIVCESHELSDMHLRVDERRCLNALNRNNVAPTIRFQMKGRITTRQMKLNCMIQAVLGCLTIPDPSLNQEAMKIMRIAERVCKCLVAYVTQPDLTTSNPRFYTAILNALTLAKCITAHLWENSIFISKQLKGIGPTFSTLLATAGKVNFMLLEESHPRDLERIMNKGPPAGNVIRKQVSLLPKYQITATPADSTTVTIKLILLNQTYLSENMDNLTAGESHKSYILVGDSENYLIQLTFFKDKDLISVYDGSITYKITRKHNFEHKIYIHCISSNFVGIDDYCEYVFNDLNTFHIHAMPTNFDITVKKSAMKQTTITETFKERKRKINNEVTESKEKKKRDYAIVEKFNSLKESFGLTSKELKNDLYKTVEDSNKFLQDLTSAKNATVPTAKCNEKDELENVFESECSLELNQINLSPKNKTNTEDILILEEYNDDDDKINCLLNEIENEMSNTKQKDKKKPASCEKMYTKQNIQTNPFEHKGIVGKKKKPSKNNYNFIELLEKDMDLNDKEDLPNTCTGFSEAIKSGVSKYLENQTLQTSDARNVDLAKLLLNEMETNQNNPQNEISRNVDDAGIWKLSINNQVTSEEASKLNDTKVENNEEKMLVSADKSTVTELNTCVINKSPNINTNNATTNYCLKVLPFTARTNEQNTNNNEQIHNISIPKFNPNNNLDNFAVNNIPLHLDVSAIHHYNDIKSSELNKCTSITTTTQHPAVTLNRFINNDNEIHRQKSMMNDDFSLNEDTIKTYSYSATKIDVCNKKIQDYRFRVIRKVKVDLDITEIVSKTDQQNEFTENTNNLSTNDIKSSIKNTHFPTDVVETSTKSITFKDDLINTIDNKELNLINRAQENTDNSLNTETSDFKYIENLYSFAKDKETAKIIDPLTNELKETESENQNKTIASVLQKYSQILSQTKPKENDQDIPKVIESKIVKSNTKTKRPFRIHEIQNVDIPIPNSLIETKTSETPYTHPWLIKPKDIQIKTQNEDRNDLINVTKEDDIFELQNELKIPVIIQNDVERVIEEYYPTTPTFQENIDNCNIDQSMFDPKTLLQQCTENDDNDTIIPPPQEFSDFISNYSPVSNNEYNFDCNLFNEYSQKTYDSEVFFENYSLISGEMDEILIPKNDSLNTSSIPMSSMEALSVKPPKSSLFSSQSIPVKHKLEQFKLPQKDKMKMSMNLR